MAESFAEKKAAEVSPLKKAPELVSQVIRRGPAELHTPIDALSICSENMRIQSEGTYHSVSTADSKMRIAANVQQFVQEGTTPVHERFMKMLQSV